MGSWNRLVLLLTIATTAAVMGCAGGSSRHVADDQETPPFVEWPGSPNANNASRPPASASRSSASPLAKATATAASIGDSVSGAFKTAAHKVSDATRIKPKVKPAPDAVDLANMPDHLSPILYIRGAAFSEAKGDLALAQQQYEKALELDPNDVLTLIAYARFRDRVGDSKQALEIYQRARAAKPNNATVWNDLAMCHARRGEADHALAAIEQAVSLQEDNVRYRNNLAAILVQANRPEDAVRELGRVHPPAVACHNVGCLLVRLRNHALATEYVRRAVSLDPSLQRAQSLLVRLDPEDAEKPGEQRVEAWNATVSPPMPAVEPPRTQKSNDAGDLRDSPWQPEPRDATDSSHRQPSQEAAVPRRFPRVQL
ncbi:MAG: tetratricopeptide repeat protein [Planctomycetes bacterium]|nr:tetratricopeptide repeat protein [Planctomycetota bacterium]MBL7039246.1 tetratricopeptide repeat protein [Pirellulaceae bacterium]